jgi:hypothetical protein
MNITSIRQLTVTYPGQEAIAQEARWDISNAISMCRNNRHSENATWLLDNAQQAYRLIRTKSSLWTKSDLRFIDDYTNRCEEASKEHTLLPLFQLLTTEDEDTRNAASAFCYPHANYAANIQSFFVDALNQALSTTAWHARDLFAALEPKRIRGASMPRWTERVYIAPPEQELPVWITGPQATEEE